MSVQPEYASLLQKLVEGVDPDALSDDEFDQLEFFTSSGFVTIDNHPDAPGWELGFLNFRTVQDQFNHVTFKVVDSTDNKVGDSIREALLTAGLKESETPRLTIAVSDSYQDLPNVEGNMLPVVVNRMKPSVGPMVFPWGDHVRDLVLKSEHYLPKPNYKLPDAFDKLQRAWVSVAVLQAIGAPKLRYTRNFCEYDMSEQEFHLWPMK